MENDNLSSLAYGMTPEGRAEQLVRDLSFHIKDAGAGEWLLPDTCLWLFREVRELIQNAVEIERLQRLEDMENE